MKTNKIDLDLKGVPQTLLLPLLGRAKFSREHYSPIQDERALKLTQSLNYDFEKLLKQIGSKHAIFWIARAYHFDQAIKEFLQKYPNGVVVNLGAGLETAFYRVDNGTLTWVDLDLPEVITLRKKLLQAPNRVHSIEKSVLDYSWMDEIKHYGKDVFFFAGGLFMYFTEAQVKSLFLEMAKQFPNAELIFDSISTKGLAYANAMLNRASMEDSILKWALDYAKDLKTWSPKINVVAQTRYFAGLKSKYKFPLTMRMRMYFYDLSEKGGIIHLQFT